jgi:hypothetical protein
MSSLATTSSLHIGQYVRVSVQGEHNRGVTQPFGDNLGVYTRLEKHRSMRMASSVESDPR